MLRNPRGPEGRKNKPYHHPDLHRSSRQDAGVELARPVPLCEPQDAASTRNAERGPRDIRAKARAYPPSKEPGKDARLLTRCAGLE